MASIRLVIMPNYVVVVAVQTVSYSQFHTDQNRDALPVNMPREDNLKDLTKLTKFYRHLP